MQLDPDDELILRAARGDRAAAARLMMRHLPKMLSLARRMLASRGEGEAEDAVQDAFLRLWQYAGRWQPGRAKVETWLYRVVLNQCYDRLRRRTTAPLEAAAETPDPAPGARAQLLAAERGRAVQAALEKLPERQKTALLLCHWQEMGNIEAAEVMGISVEAIESLLARGRRTLRDRLADWKEG
ncbi:MAG: RNA polymerase sigma factor [Rhizomicrobium sp.]